MAKSIALALLNQGPVKRHNEDNVYILDRYVHTAQSRNFEHSASSSAAVQFFAVADGMGGGGIGDVAARTVMQVLDQQQQTMKPGNRFDFTSFSRDTVDLANRAVCEQLSRYEGLQVGTTFSFLAIDQDTAYTISLGDSRIYLLRDHQLQKLTEDHISQLPDHHQLTRYLGFLADDSILASDNMTRTVLQRSDVFLLATDGVTDVLTEEKILAVLEEPVAFVQQIRRLRDLVFQEGGRDNIALIGVKIHDPLAVEQAGPRPGTRRSRRAGRLPASDRQTRPAAGNIWPGGRIPSWMRFLLFFLFFILIGMALGKVIFSLPDWLSWLTKALGGS